MKIEDEFILKERWIFAKIVKKNEKKDFSAVLNMAHKINKSQKAEDKRPVIFNVYIIASKIANGESVTSEEFEFIRENAPALLEEAERQRDKRKGIEKCKNTLNKSVKSEEASGQVSNDTSKAEKSSIKSNSDMLSNELLNKL